MSHPRVTLGVTTYNVERYLAKAFDAALAQDFTDFEVVVCDNQSSDTTWDICQEYAARDERFRIFRNDANLGVAGNFNKVVSLARGDYFRYTAHDDLMAPALLSRCLEKLEQEPDAVLAFPRTVVIDSAGDPVCPWEGDRELSHPSPSRRITDFVRTWGLCNELFGLVRTPALRRTRLLSPFVSADKRLLVELLARGGFYLVEEPLFYRRIHASATFGEDRTPEQVYQWLEPEIAGKGRVPPKYGKPRGDHNKLTVATLKALAVNELPLAVRLPTTATFATVWPLRRAQITLGRWRRELTGRQMAPPPWETTT